MNIQTVTVGQMKTLLKSVVFPANQPALFVGSPGVGKTESLYQAAKEYAAETGDAFDVWEIRGTTIDPVDLRGIPVPDKKTGTTSWYPPDFLPRDPKGRGVIFLDELPNSDPGVQKALLSLVWERRLGDYRVPEHVVFVAAGNRTADRAGANRLISSMCNRFSHYNVSVDVKEWAGWAMTNGVHDAVIAHIRANSGALHKPDDKVDTAVQPAFPTPRTWVRLARDLAAVERGGARADDWMVRAVAAGNVGPGAAAEFMAFLKLREKMPPIDAVLADPLGAPVPTEASLQHAVISGLAARFRTDGDLYKPALEYLNRLPNEYIAYGVADLILLNMDVHQGRYPVQNHPVAIEHIKELSRRTFAAAGGKAARR
jgi:MoxR-like ATPase